MLRAIAGVEGDMKWRIFISLTVCCAAIAI